LHPSSVGGSLDLPPRRSHNIRCSIHHRTGAAKSKLPRRIASQPAKPLLINHIARWVFRCTVVVAGPVRDLCPGMIEAEEQAFVEKLISHPAVETLAEAVLHGFARCDEVPGNVMFFRPGQHGVLRELGAIVRDDHWQRDDWSLGVGARHNLPSKSTSAQSADAALDILAPNIHVPSMQ